MKYYTLRLMFVLLMMGVCGCGQTAEKGPVGLYYASVPESVTASITKIGGPVIAEIKSKYPLDGKEYARLEKNLKGVSRYSKRKKEQEEDGRKRGEIISIGIAAVPVLADRLQSGSDVVRRDACAALAAISESAQDRRQLELLVLLFCRSVYDRDASVRMSALSGLRSVTIGLVPLPEYVPTVLEQAARHDPYTDNRIIAEGTRIRLGLVSVPDYMKLYD